MKYGIILDNEHSKNVGVSIVTRPSIPAPIKKFREIEVLGKNGKLYEDLGVYDDIEITIKCNFSEKADKWNETFRNVKRWVKDKTKLKFTDDLGYFYVIKKVTIESSERVRKQIGRFDLKFVCEPFMYLTDGQDEIYLNKLIYNDFETTQPIYNITGEGLLTIVKDGVTIKANVGQNLTIDTKKGLCYRSDGTINNIALTGNFKDLYLEEGDNNFTWTSGFTIKLIPNWRCL